MSEKSIIVTIEKVRRKRLKFSAVDRVLPLNVREALLNSSSNDEALKALLQNKFIILQRNEEGLGLIDLEEDDEILTGDEIVMVLMSSVVSEVSLPVSENDPLSLAQVSFYLSKMCYSELTYFEIEFYNIKFYNQSRLFLFILEKSFIENMYTERINVQSLKIHNFTMGIKYSFIIIWVLYNINYISNFIYILNFQIPVPVSNEMLKDIIGENNAEQSVKVVSKARKYSRDTNSIAVSSSIPKNYKLPRLAPELAKLQKEGLVYKEQIQFNKFWAADLKRLTDGEPSRSDYATYASLIVKDFPELKSTTGPNDYVSIHKYI